MSTLETIPEEPTAPTPARVTADPPKSQPAKNPKRVAAGKKLAERNRRVRQVLEELQQEETATESKSDTTDSKSGGGLSFVVVLGIGGLIVSLVSLYYQREAVMTKLKPAPPAPPPTPEPAPSRIPVKRGLRKME